MCEAGIEANRLDDVNYVISDLERGGKLLKLVRSRESKDSTNPMPELDSTPIRSDVRLGLVH